MSDHRPDSESVRPPTTNEYSYQPVVGAPDPRASGSSTAVIAIVAIVLVTLIGGAAGLVFLGGGSDDDAEQPTATSSADGGAGSDGSVAEPMTTPTAPDPQPTITPVTAAPDTASPAPETSATSAAPTTSPPPTPTVAPTVAPPPSAVPSPAQVGPPTVAASVERPGGEDSCTPPNVTSYAAGLAYDSSTDTAWMAPGDGVGQRLVFTFPEPVTVSEVGLFPGYGKFDPCTGDDRFFQLRRIGSVQWMFEDGSVVDQTFTSEKSVQSIPIAPRATRSVTISIVTTIDPGIARLDHTPISEVVIA